MEQRRRFLSLKNACEYVFMDSDLSPNPSVICTTKMRTFWLVATILIFLTWMLKLKTFPVVLLVKIMQQSWFLVAILLLLCRMVLQRFLSIIVNFNFFEFLVWNGWEFRVFGLGCKGLMSPGICRIGEENGPIWPMPIPGSFSSFSRLQTHQSFPKRRQVLIFNFSKSSFLSFYFLFNLIL